MEFKSIKTLYGDHQPFEIHNMVLEFIVDSKIKNVDKVGYYEMTVKNINKAIMCPTDDHQFWLLSDHNKCLGFACTNITIDVDNSRCFYAYLAYVKPEVRGKSIVKHCAYLLKAEAKKQDCIYFIVPTNRNPEVFKRFLGHKVDTYCTLLKERI